jgi:hypothetical protein
MPQDSNAERRNLVLTSLSFIIYNLAGGKLPDGSTELKLNVISLEFTKPEYLLFFAYLMLLWFLLRYWQTNKNKYIEAYYDYINKYNSKYKGSVYYLTKQLNIGNKMQVGHIGTNSLIYKNKKLHVSYDTYKTVVQEVGGYSVSMNNNTIQEEVRGLYRNILKLKIYISFMFETDGFTSYAGLLEIPCQSDKIISRIDNGRTI